MGRLDSKIPSLVAGIDVRRLPLDAREGFVLSRVDGSTSVAEISMMSGIAVEELDRIVTRLVQLGAVRLAVGANDSASSGVRESTPPRAVPSFRPATTSSATDSHIEDVDLAEERRQEIDRMHARLAELTHYQLLGVSEDAEKGEIRAAYFELSKRFHPDTMFRKQIGGYRTKMETIFSSLTDAYDTLGKNRSRREYDEYLALSRRTREAQNALLQSEGDVEAVRAAVDARDDTPTSAAPPPMAGSAAGEAHAAGAPPASRRPSEAAQRAHARRKLQRRLQSITGQRRAWRPSGPKPSGSGGARSSLRPEQVARELTRSLRQVANVTGGVGRAERYARAARAAEAEGRLVEAANCYRVALSFAPESAELSRAYERARLQVAASLADQYEKQAKYEEKVGSWSAAAVSWSKVSEGRPRDAEAARRTAAALLRAEGDARRAQRYAERAVELSPSDATSYRILGEAFLAAGFPLNARKALENASRLDPRDTLTKTLLKQTR